MDKKKTHEQVLPLSQNLIDQTCLLCRVAESELGWIQLQKKEKEGKRVNKIDYRKNKVIQNYN